MRLHVVDSHIVIPFSVAYFGGFWRNVACKITLVGIVSTKFFVKLQQLLAMLVSTNLHVITGQPAKPTELLPSSNDSYYQVAMIVTTK